MRYEHQSDLERYAERGRGSELMAIFVLVNVLFLITAIAWTCSATRLKPVATLGDQMEQGR